MRQILPLSFAAVGLAIVAVTPGQSRAANLTTLVSFNRYNDGIGDLIADASGNLFGTSGTGAAIGEYSTVYEIAKTAGGYASTRATLVSFSSWAGPNDGGLTTDANGNLFAMSSDDGGGYGYGGVFEIAKTASGYASTPTTLVKFNFTNGANPWADLIADASGNLFGTTLRGGTHGKGTVFEIAKAAGGGYASTPTTLVSFCAEANCTDGAFPNTRLTADANGNLFGTTSGGGADGAGTVFEIAKTAGGYASTPTTLFNRTNGDYWNAGLNASLIADASGNLFGTTHGGGAYGEAVGGDGTVFEIAKTAGGYASTPIVLVNFSFANGAMPTAGLIADANGNLFGTTGGGGAYGYGTAFKVAKTASGYASTPIVLVNFNFDSTSGDIPLSRLTADANLFGRTSMGGAYGHGTVFEIAGSGFVTSPGTPEKGNRHGRNASELAK